MVRAGASADGGYRQIDALLAKPDRGERSALDLALDLLVDKGVC